MLKAKKFKEVFRDCDIGRKIAKALWRSSGKENEFFDIHNRI
ncbi:hypothetical protein [Clostridium psychrophilum]|nr:hypothetical protein [Clostridium psychrophilum]